MSLKRTRRSKKKMVYHYDAELDDINVVIKPEGFNYDERKKAYTRKIKLKTSERAIRNQAENSIKHWQKKRKKIERLLERTKNNGKRKTLKRALEKIDQRESLAEDKFKDPAAYIEGVEEERYVINTSAVVYATGVFTNGGNPKKVKFRCRVNLSYVAGDEGLIPARIQEKVREGLEEEGAYNLENLNEFSITEVEA